jgi:DNA-directed RNA polymerase specialized sigma24 family protein
LYPRGPDFKFVDLDLPFSTEDLTRLYRFALLLTGNDAAAQQVMYDATVDCASRIAGYRSVEGRFACMIGSLRARAKNAAASPTEPNGLPKAFSNLPEEERAALAGMYVGLLPAGALAEALKLPLDKLGRVLKSAREHLAAASPDFPEPGAPSVEQAV